MNRTILSQLKRSVFCALAVAVALSVTLATVHAQTTGAILGTVEDETGAVIAGARVTAINLATGLERTVETDSSGAFEFPVLPIGTYRVRCEKEGFKTKIREDVVLQIAQRVRLDFQLVAGAPVEEITISTGTTLVNTQSAELGEVIENRRILDLPLNGRQFLQLAELTPGVSRGPTGGFRGGLTGNLTGPNITVNGSRDTDNYYTVDGVSVNDRFFNSLTVSPSVEAIQEFKVQSSLYSAEAGVTSGAQINIAIKSGSNEFHGSIYEFFRNDRLNARNFFDDAKPVYQQNQFGFTAGGRIIRDRTFFFGNFEGLRLRVPQTRTLTVPTLKMKRGDFSEVGDGDPATRNDIDLRDPYAPGAPFRNTFFPGNQIPMSRFDPVARDLLSLWPDPNRPGLSQNLVASPAFRNRTDQFTFRIDHRLSSKDTLYGRFIFSNITAYSPFGAITQGTRTGAAVPGFGWDLTTNNRNLALNYTRVWSSKLVGEFRFGYNRTFGGQEHEQRGNNVAARNNIQGLVDQTELTIGVPRINVVGFSPFGDEPNTITRVNNDYQYDYNVTYTVGAHTLKFGFQYARVNFAPAIQNFVRGSYSFGSTRNTSNHPFADFLLGLPHQGATGAIAAADFRGNEFYWYVQDSWRVNARLTLDYGLRYDYQEPLADRNLQLSNFDLNRTRKIIIPSEGGRIAPASEFRSASLRDGFSGFPIMTSEEYGIHPGLIHEDKNNFGPRFGLAWSVLGDDRLVLRTGYGIYYNRKEQFAATTMTARPPFGYTGSRQNFFVATPARNPDGTPITIANFMGVNPAAFALLLPVDPEMRSGYAQQWSLNIQTTPVRDLMFETGYVGSKGTRLFLTDSRNYRRPLQDNATREFFPYVFGMAVWTDYGFSTYHSWQTRVVKRLSGGLQFSANYTWAKSLDNNSAGSSGSNDSDSGGISNPFNRKAEKGRSAFDARHRFVVSAVYELPFGPGRAFGASATGVGRKLIEGWQISGIGSYRTGTAFTVDSTTDFHQIGRTNSNRPNLIGDPNAGPRTAEQWFNVAAFVTPTPGFFGTAGRNIVEADSFSAIDLSFQKETSITERWRVQFRWEIFNLLNQTNFAVPDRTFVAPIDAPGGVANINPNFGRVFTAADPRVMQVALKLIF
ncbi:MAG: TonB-dependent receptor [Acidobacteriota bacterium]|nr:TonB-dependent receptor [Acidobacteriota bacterium]